MSSASGSDSESDIEIKTPLPPKILKKLPKSPHEHLQKEAKKFSTKEMIHSALEELKSRKGVSLYAIKKYMVEKYNADTDKINFYIKKYIKSGVEAGTIVQTKGIGASGSFKLAPVKKTETKPKKKKLEKPDKPKKEKTKKSEKEKTKTEKKVVTKEEKITKEKSKKEKEVKKPKVKMSKENKKEKVTKESKKGNKKVNKVKDVNTPVKKKITMIKRKSIGSIIKPPKMKPKMRE